MNETEEKIKEILESLSCILTAHDSCAELMEFKDNKAFIYCGRPCVQCDNKCIEGAIKDKLPDVEVIIRWQTLKVFEGKFYVEKGAPGNMLIKVMYKDGKLGEIENYLLDDLIHSKKIKKFQRSSGWVTIGVDPIRETRREDYLEAPKREEYGKKAKKGK
jgi:hypothetical protein